MIISEFQPEETVPASFIFFFSASSAVGEIIDTLSSALMYAVSASKLCLIEFPEFERGGIVSLFSGLTLDINSALPMHFFIPSGEKSVVVEYPVFLPLHDVTVKVL